MVINCRLQANEGYKGEQWGTKCLVPLPMSEKALKYAVFRQLQGEGVQGYKENTVKIKKKYIYIYSKIVVPLRTPPV